MAETAAIDNETETNFLDASTEPMEEPMAAGDPLPASTAAAVESSLSGVTESSEAEQLLDLVKPAADGVTYREGAGDRPQSLENMLGMLWIPGDRTSLLLALLLFAISYILTLWALHFAMQMLLPVSIGIFVRYMLPFIQDGSIQMMLPALGTIARNMSNGTAKAVEGMSCFPKWRSASQA